MSPKFTAAHWGTYEIGAAGLTALPRDGHPSRIGRGWMDTMQDKGTRIARPAIRKGWLHGRDCQRHGAAEFVELPWDEALDITAVELRRVINSHGNGALFAGSYGWAAAGRFHHAQSQLRRFLNTVGGFVGAANTYSHAGAEVLLPHVVGMSNRVFQDQMTSWPLIVEHCQLLVSFGGLSKRPAQVASSGTTTHQTRDWLDRAGANGCHLVNVSPQTSDMANAEWIAPRPGSDTALILALCHVLFATNRADDDFLSRFTHGAGAFRAYVMGETDGTAKTPEWASALCDLPAATIRDLAGRMADKRTMINVAWALQRADHGEVTLWAALALACLLGQIGKPGTGFGFGYGSTETVGRPAKLIDWPSLPQGYNGVADFIPVARIADMLDKPGTAYAYDGQTRSYPDARMIWWSGGNPFHHHQDLARLDHLWRKPETVVVIDPCWTATARRADIVLPCTSSLERDDIMVNRRDPALVYMSAAMPVMGEARDDYAILSGLADRMGTHAAFTQGRSAEEWLRQIWAGCQGTAQQHGFALPDFDRFRAEGLFDIPDSDETRLQFAEFVASAGAKLLNTPSGKIELFCDAIAAMRLPDCSGLPEWRAPTEGLGTAQPGQLHLISGQPDTRLHSQNDPGSVARDSKIAGREPCVLHPETAAALGLKARDVALIEDARGACFAGVTLSRGMRRDCVVLNTGAWLDLRQIDGRDICVHGNCNMLTLDKGATALSQGNIAHTALVRVSRWAGDLPCVTVHQLPPLS